MYKQGSRLHYVAVLLVSDLSYAAKIRCFLVLESVQYYCLLFAVGQN